MAEFKSHLFESNEIPLCKGKMDAVNVGPYNLSKLVISDEFSSNQSHWSCSSSQSGSTEAEDDSRIEREKSRESFRSYEDARNFNASLHPDTYSDFSNQQKKPSFRNTMNFQGVQNGYNFDCSNTMNQNLHMNDHKANAERNYSVNYNMQARSQQHYEYGPSPNMSYAFAQQEQRNNGSVNFGTEPSHSYQYDMRPMMRPQVSAVPQANRVPTLQQTYLNRPSEIPTNYQRPQLLSPLSSTYHNPAPHGVNTLNGMIYQVQFKCMFRHFILGANITPNSVTIGDFVVVEADRGEDIGIVSDVLPMKTFVERRIYMKTSVEDDNVIGRIVRVASVAERQFLPEKFHDEDNILQFCRELSHSTYRLPMVIHDVEYQFDRHKLTVYYAADSRVDFREFVRDLFSAYKARIWMKKLNTQRPIKLENWATVALATGMQFSPDSK